MAYDEYLKRTLKPLGIYDFDNGYGADEINCEGSAMDVVYEALESLDEGRSIDTATEAQLAEYEKLLPFVPCSTTLSQRRNAIKAILGTVDRCMTQAELNRALPGCGIGAKAYETDTAQTIKIVFTDPPTDAEKLAEIKSRVEEIVPCHLAIIYE